MSEIMRTPKKIVAQLAPPWYFMLHRRTTQHSHTSARNLLQINTTVTMAELSKTALVSTETGGKQDVEFIVHKNSSCCRDCYQWPIIGQCYLSKLYDVQRCARCVETYSGEATDLEVKKASSGESASWAHFTSCKIWTLSYLRCIRWKEVQPWSCA